MSKGYARLKNYAFKDESSKLKWILYHTTNVERNAYVAQIIKEIKPYLPDCDTSAKAWDALSNSSIWKNVLVMEKWIANFNNHEEKINEYDLIKYWNHVTKQNIDNYDSFIKHLNKRWNIFKRKLITQLSKQMYDNAMKNPNWNYLNPSSNKILEF